MRYTVTSNFIKISESAGTIQNTSQIYTLEVSASTTKDSGVLVFSHNTIEFKGSPVYIRCVEDDGFIDVRVFSFDNVTPSEDDDPNVVIIDGVQYTVESGANMNSVTDSIFDNGTNPVAPDADINAALDDIFSGNDSQTSSGDSDFDSSLDNIFG